MAYNPDQPRGPDGKWSEEGATAASAKADEATSRADRADEDLARASQSGGNEWLHKQAVKAHQEAASAHREMAEKQEAAGNHASAEEHRKAAGEHERMVGVHQRSITPVEPKVVEPKGPAKKIRNQEARARRIGRKRENDEAVAVNLEPHLLPLWNKMKDEWNPRHMNPEQREEKFRQYVHDHQKEVQASVQREADTKLSKLIAQREGGGLKTWAEHYNSGKPTPKANATKGLTKWAKSKASESQEVPF